MCRQALEVNSDVEKSTCHPLNVKGAHPYFDYQARNAVQAQNRKELTDFASLELSTTAESEQALAGRVIELEGKLAEHRIALEDTTAQLSSAQIALAQAEDKVLLACFEGAYQSQALM